MSDLIDRQALKDYVSSLSTHPLNEWDTWGVLAAIDKQPTITAPRWHRVEEPPREHGPFLCAAKHERNGQTHWFFELCWYADGDLKDVVFDAEQDSGFYSWSAYHDRDIDSMVDYWMPIEPPKEE